MPRLPLALPLALLLLLLPALRAQQSLERRVGSLQEVFAWRQLTYVIGGQQLLRDRAGSIDETEGLGPLDPGQERDSVRLKRQMQGRSDSNNRVFVNNNQGRPNNRPSQSQQLPSWGLESTTTQRPTRPSQSQQQPSWGSQSTTTERPTRPSQSQQQPSWGLQSTTTERPTNESGRFFIQYNNVPMGVERVGSRLFITVPRRRFGIPSTLNYLDLRQDSMRRSPALRPYPDLRQGSGLLSVYRTRADVCGRLWMVDTGLLEIPDNRRQVQPPAIVVFDLRTNKQLMRYPFKSSDLPSETTPAGLASITVDVTAEDCAGAVAYVPDLNTNGIIVFSLRERDSWRHEHNYFHFNPSASTLSIAGQRFQWNDGIFSITLGAANARGCRPAYFHPLVSFQEFSVSTCVLRDRNASQATDYWTQFNLLGERGADTQSTVHGLHEPTGVIFFAEPGRSAVSCWQTADALRPSNLALLAQDSRRMSYPSDLHVTGDEVWVMANSMPRFIYSRLDTSQYNFFIYRGSVQEMIQNTPCANGLTLTGQGSPGAVTFRDVAPSNTTLPFT